MQMIMKIAESDIGQFMMDAAWAFPSTHLTDLGSPSGTAVFLG